MFLTNLLLKKAKSKLILVQIQSVISGHKYNQVRERLGDKVEVIKFDPYSQTPSIYKEVKKLKSLKK